MSVTRFIGVTLIAHFRRPHAVFGLEFQIHKGVACGGTEAVHAEPEQCEQDHAHHRFFPVIDHQSVNTGDQKDKPGNEKSEEPDTVS